MDQIRFGAQTVLGDVFSRSEVLNGRSVPVLELRLSSGISAEQLQALQEHPLEIANENDVVQGTKTGYGTLLRHSVVLANVTATEQALDAANAENAALEAENAALLYENLTGEELLTDEQ